MQRKASDSVHRCARLAQHAVPSCRHGAKEAPVRAELLRESSVAAPRSGRHACRGSLEEKAVVATLGSRGRPPRRVRSGASVRGRAAGRGVVARRRSHRPGCRAGRRRRLRPSCARKEAAGRRFRGTPLGVGERGRGCHAGWGAAPWGSRRCAGSRCPREEEDVAPGRERKRRGSDRWSDAAEGRSLGASVRAMPRGTEAPGAADEHHRSRRGHGAEGAVPLHAPAGGVAVAAEVGLEAPLVAPLPRSSKSTLSWLRGNLSALDG
ncbi:hypothetical protein BS78_02G052100 [Paspalum vaginatum]|nr:hypothetical protein BS78_02G052100 [Paspalum vaginatum]